MMKNKQIIGGLLMLISGFAFSQSILNATSPEELRQLREERQEKKGDSLVSIKVEPLKYGYIEDKDILRSKVVWEIIDLNEKINQPFYYNSDGIVSSSKSLYQILLDGVSDAYIERINAGEQVSEEEKQQYIDVYETKTENVKMLKIKGMWYIDRRDGQMKYRL